MHFWLFIIIIYIAFGHMKLLKFNFKNNTNINIIKYKLCYFPFISQ
jgi:hypothetical protein